MSSNIQGDTKHFLKCIKKGPTPPMKLMRASTLKMGLKVETPKVSWET